MMLGDVGQLLLSQTAILIYEILMLIVLLVFILLLSRKRKQRKQIKIMMQERQIHQLLDDSLANNRRR